MDTKLKKSNSYIYGVMVGLSTTATVLGFFLGISLINIMEKVSILREVGDNRQLINLLIPVETKLWIGIIVFGVILLGSLIEGAVLVGKRDEYGKIVLNWFDKIYTEIQILIVISMVGVFILVVTTTSYLIESSWVFIRPLKGEIIRTVKDAASDGGDFVEAYDFLNTDLFSMRAIGLTPEVLGSLVGLGSLIVTILLICICMSLIKKIKSRSFFSHSLLGKISQKIGDYVGQQDRVEVKTLLFLLSAPLIIGIFGNIYGTLIWVVLSVTIAFKELKNFKEIQKGVREVKSGNLVYRIPVVGSGEFSRIGQDINCISLASAKAVENELKNEKMKVELISNVSHDLKTPITSMITYLDLIKNEGLHGNNATEYLRIIDEKTRRLQRLTEDLFEAAKASSGSINVNAECIDLNSVVNQSLGELNAGIEEANLKVIFHHGDKEKNHVMADGRLLWRVIENLIINTTKYALEGSRVYIDVKEDLENNSRISLEIKNISKNQLNIQPDVLMERFTRGDDSRNTEGSGLGLAIAKDLTKLMGGELKIDIDGDLFKVTLLLDKCN